MFAAIPLVFACQQAAEGAVWLTLGQTGSDTLRGLAVNVYLGFALIVWPTWMPLALASMEPSIRRRRLLTILVGFGVVGATYAAALLIQWQPAAAVVGHSIAYDFPGRGGALRQFVHLFAYLIPTIAPSSCRASR